MTLILGLLLGLIIGIIVMFFLMKIILTNFEKTLEKQFAKRLNAFSTNQELLYESRISNKEHEFIDREKHIRNDSAKKSRSVRLGSVAEKLIPISGKLPYDSEDMYFLGKPVDYIVFNGQTEGNLNEIVFLEIKTGKSGLTENEKNIKDIIEKKKVFFKMFRFE